MSTDTSIRSDLTAATAVLSAPAPTSSLPVKSSSSPAPEVKRIDIVIFCLIGCATAALFARAVGFDFVGYDDMYYLASNPHIRAGLSWSSFAWALKDQSQCNWNPLTLLVQQSIVSLFGMHPWAFHLVNILLHAGTAALLYAFLRTAFGPTLRLPALAATLLWAWHPLRVQSVAWCMELKDVLCGLFCMACLLAYARYRRRPGARAYSVVVLMFALALMAKPMAVTLPAVMLLLDFWPLGDPSCRLNLRWWGWRLLEKLPLAPLMIASSIVTMVFQSNGGALPSARFFPLNIRLENAVVSYARYIGKTFWPSHLAVFYPHPAMINASIPAWQWIAAAGLLLLIILIALLQWRRRPYLAVGWFWFLGTLLPVIGIVQAGEQAMADRYTYLPAIGLTIAVTWFVTDLVIAARAARARLQAVACVAGAIVILVLACRTFIEIGYWRDTHTLFTRANQAVPNNYLAQCLLSGYLRDEKRIDDALAMSHEAAVTAPNSGGAHRQYALSLQVAGRRKEALHELRLAVQLNPTDFNVFNDIGGVLVEEGRDDQALEMFQRAVAMEPDFAMARHNLAVMLANKGRMDEAIAHWRVAEQLEPANGIVHGFLGEALRLRGDRRGAVTEYAAMWASKDHRPEWETNYAWLVATDPISSPEEIDLAVGAARDACTSAPADQKALAQDALAAALARAGQFNDAGAAAQQGVDLANAAGQPALAKAITARSALYRAGQPYFEQPKR